CRSLPSAEAEAEAALGRLQDASGRTESARGALAAAEATRDAAERARDEHRAVVADCRLRHAGCPCGPVDDVEAATIHDRHTAVCGAVDRVIAAQARHADAVARRRERSARAVGAATERGFASLEEARVARLAPAVVDRLR